MSALAREMATLYDKLKVAVSATPLSQAATALAHTVHSVAWVKLPAQEDISKLTVVDALEQNIDSWVEVAKAIKERVATRTCALH